MGEKDSRASTGDNPEGVPNDDDPVNADSKAEEEILTVPSTERDDEIPADAAEGSDTAGNEAEAPD